MEAVSLFFWKSNIGHGNFGDELSAFITKQLVDHNKYDLVFNDETATHRLICVGSYITAARDNYNIFGSGVRTLDQKKEYDNLNVHAVRGPLTRKYLMSHGIDCPEIYGDPALLLSRYYEPNIRKELKDKIGIVPHFTNYQKYLQKNIDRKFHLINPCDKWSDVIDQICSCKAVVSSSLHGLICSDAYNVPNLWINEFALREGTLKFEDYFMSQGRDTVNIKSLSEYDDELLYMGGNKIDLDILISVFPF